MSETEEELRRRETLHDEAIKRLLADIETVIQEAVHYGNGELVVRGDDHEYRVPIAKEDVEMRDWAAGEQTLDQLACVKLRELEKSGLDTSPLDLPEYVVEFQKKAA